MLTPVIQLKLTERARFIIVAVVIAISVIPLPTPIAGLRTPLSRIIEGLKVRTEGQGLNATARVFGVSKKSIIDWEWRLSELKLTLLLYGLMHQFLSLVVEGDEFYTKVHHNTPTGDSEGWTMVLMERSSRFLWELNCGSKDEQLFEAALSRLCEVMQQTQDLTLFSDGERRYGKILFAICHEVIHTGQPVDSRNDCPKECECA
jgi:hypothetical protein